MHQLLYRKVKLLDTKVFTAERLISASTYKLTHFNPNLSKLVTKPAHHATSNVDTNLL